MFYTKLSLLRVISRVKAARAGAIALMLAAMLAIVFFQAPVAHASGGGTVDWDPGMIFPGQTTPSGPVGENVTVHGNYLPNQALTLKIVQGDAFANPGTVCLEAGVNVASVTTDGSGNFQQNFQWPASAGLVNTGYSVCTVSAGNTPHAGSHPFTVLSSGKPAIALSVYSVVPGGSVTVTGRNWVPPQPISVNIAGCAACDPGNSEVVNGTTNSMGQNTGTFSVTLTIPANARPGHYVVDAQSNNGLLEAFYTTGVRHLTITAAPAPTATAAPTATTAVTPTTTAGATPSAVPTTTTTSSNTDTGSGTGGGNPLLMIALVIAALLLLSGIIGIIVYARVQRSKRNAPAPGYGQYGQLMSPNGMPGGPDAFAGYNMPPPAGPNGQFGQYAPYTPPPVMPGDPNRTTPYTSQAGTGFANAPTWAMPSPQASQPADFPGNGNGNFGRPTRQISSSGWPGNSRVGANFVLCTQCGNPLSPDEAFCGKCGARRAGPGDGNANTWIG